MPLDRVADEVHPGLASGRGIAPDALAGGSQTLLLARPRHQVAFSRLSFDGRAARYEVVVWP